MPPLPALLLLLLLLLAASASAASFTCVRRSTCQPAIGYVVPNATTYEKLISRFSPTCTLHDLLAANQLPSETAPNQAIPARTTLSIPFRCRCTGNGVGQSDLYTVQTGTGADDLEIVTANNIILGGLEKQKLPCSCDKVDGSHVMHFAYIVRSGDTTLEIAANYRVRESTLLRINNITNHTSLRQGQILDVPLQGMGTWSRVHYISGYRKRSLVAGTTTKAVFKLGFGLARHTVLFVLLGVFLGILVVILLSLLYTTCYYWKSACRSLSSETDGVMQFDYSELARATHRFSKTSMTGEGNYGAVYKATYKGQQVAVKKMKATGETKDFHSELQTVSNTRHTNLVRLKGWCGRIRLIDGKSCWQSQIKVELVLVFELIPNGNLEHHLYNREHVLPWEKRYEIVKGIGCALRYLHHECNPCILHRDIKPANILLDNQFNAKLADFGLSLLTSQNRATVVTTAEGTRRYMDPQLQKDGNVEFNRKSDVYSFGLVLLDIACTGNSRENHGNKLREQVWELYSSSTEPQVEAAADAKLRGAFDRKQMERVVILGLKCSHPEETQRPLMEDAMKFLEDGEELTAAGAQG